MNSKEYKYSALKNWEEPEYNLKLLGTTAETASLEDLERMILALVGKTKQIQDKSDELQQYLFQEEYTNKQIVLISEHETAINFCKKIMNDIRNMELNRDSLTDENKTVFTKLKSQFQGAFAAFEHVSRDVRKRQEQGNGKANNNSTSSTKSKK